MKAARQEARSSTAPVTIALMRSLGAHQFDLFLRLSCTMLVPLLQSHAPTSHRPGFSRGSLQVLVLHASDEPATHNSNGSRDNGFGVPMKRTLLSAFLVAAFLLPVWPQLFPKRLLFMQKPPVIAVRHPLT